MAKVTRLGKENIAVGLASRDLLENRGTRTLW